MNCKLCSNPMFEFLIDRFICSDEACKNYKIIVSEDKKNA